MGRRLRPPDRPVELIHDGDSIVAEAGEPISSALIGADRLLLARSPKLHRPRGPYCLRGSCDGCLARVNGVPNVTLCTTPALGGEIVETQNVLGARELDLLQAADFLFPRGIDHHRLLAGVPVASKAVQTFARKVAGLGRLPDDPGSPSAARSATARVLVVGAGAAGLAAAEALGKLRPIVADEGLEPGGSLLSLDPPRARRAARAAREAGATVLSRTTVAALYPASGAVRAVLAGPTGVTRIVAERVLVACGAHAWVAPFPGNDLPGVISARGALSLLRAGIVVGEPTVVVGEGRFADALRQAGDASVSALQVTADALVRATGRQRATGVVVRRSGVEQRHRAGCVALDGRGAPAVELAVQAGASVRWDATRAGFKMDRGDDGAVADRVWAAGSCAAATRPSHEDGTEVAEALAATA